MKFDIR